MSLGDLKEKAFKNPDVRQEYDKLVSERWPLIAECNIHQDGMGGNVMEWDAGLKMWVCAACRNAQED